MFFTEYDPANANSYVASRTEDALALTREILPQIRATRRMGSENWWDADVQLYGAVNASFSNGEVLWTHREQFYTGSVRAFLSYILRKFW